MGQSASRHDRSTKCLDFPKRTPSQSVLSARLRTDAVTAADSALGVKLSWLVSRHVASPSGDIEATVQRVLEHGVLPLSADGKALESDAFGPATHVVLVHPSVPWRAFIKALLHHVGMDPRRWPLAGDAPLSPRSPLIPFGTSPDAKSHNAGAGIKCADPEHWASDGLSNGGAEHPYQSTFLHIDFLAHAASSPLSPGGAAATPATSGPPDGCLAVSGDAAERVLSLMSGESTTVLVVDPAGAIFTDPRAIRATAGALAALRSPARADGGAVGIRTPRLQLASCLGGAEWAPAAAAFGRMAGLLPDDPASALAVRDAVLESARLQYAAHWPLLHLFSSRTSFCLEIEYGCMSNVNVGESGGKEAVGGGGEGGGPGAGGGGGGGGGSDGPSPAAPGRHLLPGQIETAEILAVDRAEPDPGDAEQDEGDGTGFEDMVSGGDGGGGWDGRDRGPDSQSGIVRFARDLLGSRARPSSPPSVPPADAEALSLVRRSRSLTESAISVCAAARQGPLPSAASGRGAAAFPTSGGGSGGASSARSPSSNATVGGVAFCLSNPSSTSNEAAGPGLAAAAASGAGGSSLLVAAMASVASSVGGGGLEGTGHLVAFAVEAARRYAALLEGVGLWAAAAGVLEACLCAVGERWGHRSRRMAALLAQLGKLQQLQGLYRSAEVTWRQAMEALESIHGPEGVPVLQCRVALSQVMAALREADAETMLRGALTALDTALGPAAPETLAAREALAAFLAQEARWCEAEVVYQGLLQAMEEALPPPPRQGAAAAASISQQQQRSVVRASSRALSRAASAQQLGVGQAQGRAEGGGGGAPLKRSDSRSRLAWGPYPNGAGVAAPAAAALEDGVVAAAVASAPPSPGFGGGGGASVAFNRTVLPPLPSGSGSLPTLSICPQPLPPLAALGGGSNTAPAPAPRATGGRGSLGGSVGRLRPGNADALAWSGAAAGLADVVAAVQREYGGVNELYDGMHLAGPEGSTAADLAALAAVCPRSGACIAAVVNVRRLTDPGELYDAVLAARRAALDAAHPAVLDVELQYARYLSSAGEHGRAEAVCRAVLEQLTLAPPPGSVQRRAAACGGDCGAVVPAGGAAVAEASAGHHPAEVVAQQTLGTVLLAAGSPAAATAALSAAVEVAGRLVAAGDMAAADARRVEALDSLSSVLWQRAQAGSGGSASAAPATTAAPAGPQGGGSVCQSSSSSSSSSSYSARAIQYKRQALELTVAVCGERHERVMRGWVALGQMLEAAGDLAAAERAYEAAAEVALHRHSRLSAATKAIFRQLQRVYTAQGRTADAQVLGHMYRLKGGLLSAPLPAPPLVPAQA